MPARILVCEDEAGLRETLRVLFRRAGYEVEVRENVRAAVERLASDAPVDVVVTDLVMPDGSGMEVLKAARRRDDATQVVMITAYATTEQAVEAMRQGAYDYVQKPFRNEELRATVEKAIEKRAIVDHNRALRAEVESGFRHGELIGKSDAIQSVVRMIDRVADTPTSVLITGESGTGKEMVARALHHRSSRASAPFVAVNCGALPEALMESELFGHVKGAFTGATSSKEGLIRGARGGTLFLDEVGELPANLQVKLLRVLQDRTVRPVGSGEEVEVNVRVVAATNKDVDEAVREGALRQDLFYRLNVIRIHIPPLRERAEDIPVLAEHFLRKHAALQGKRLVFSPEALRWIASQPYPGNVRELENVVERGVTLALGDEVTLDDLPAGSAREGDARVSVPRIEIGEAGLDLDAYLGEIEKRILAQALERTGGVRKHAAELLGMTFRSFRYRLAKYGIDGSDDRE